MSNWATSVLAPVIGIVLANIMWLAPLKDVYNARLSQQLGTLNPIPFTMILINCIGWTMYGVITNDMYLFFANCFGIIIGLFCSSSAMMFLLNENESKPTANEKWLIIHMEILMIGGVTFWILMIFIVGMILHGEDPSSLMIGVIGDIIAIVYYAAPLSSLYQVIVTSDASSMHVPTIIANLLNGAMWFIYGLSAINSVLVWLPNGLGVLLAITQLTVVFIYNPRCVYCEGKQSEAHQTKPAPAIGSTSEFKSPAFAASSSIEDLKQDEEKIFSNGTTNYDHKPKFRNIMAGWRTSSVIR